MATVMTGHDRSGSVMQKAMTGHRGRVHDGVHGSPCPRAW